MSARQVYSIGEHTYYPPDLQLRTWLPDERIVIGRYCSIADRVIICTGGQHRLDTVSTFPFDAQLFPGRSTNRSYLTTAATTVGNDVWIGSGAMILNGASVSDGAVIAAGSVVMSDVPPYAIVAGNPGTVLRYRFSKPTVERLLRLKWWDWPSEVVRERVDWFYRPISDFVEQFDCSDGES